MNVATLLLLVTTSIFASDLNTRAPEISRGGGVERVALSDSLDQYDLVSLFGMFSITRGRYRVSPVRPPFSLDFQIERYEDGNLVESTSISSEILAMIPNYDSSKAALYLRALLAHTVVDSVARDVRIYVRQDNPVSTRLILDMEKKQTKLEFPVDTTRFGRGGAHSFLFNGIGSGERKPMMAIYHVAKGEGFVPCPSDAPVEKIVESYPFVIVVYGAAVPLE